MEFWEWLWSDSSRGWLALIVALGAAAMSVVAVILNRQANEMKLLDRQAFFEARWGTKTGTINSDFLAVRNIGDANAFDVEVRLDIDPKHLYGLKGWAAGLTATKQMQLFAFEGQVGDMYHGLAHDPGYILTIEWTDHQKRVRRQEINGHHVGTLPLVNENLVDARFVSIPRQAPYSYGQATGRYAIPEGKKWTPPSPQSRR